MLALRIPWQLRTASCISRSHVYFLSTTSSPSTFYYAVSDKSTAKVGDHIGGKAVAAGRSTLRKGYSYSGGDYFSCCGIRAMGYGEQLYPREPCTKGEDGMYHPGEFLPRSYGSRRSGAGTGGGYLVKACWQLDGLEEVQHTVSLRDQRTRRRKPPSPYCLVSSK